MAGFTKYSDFWYQLAPTIVHSMWGNLVDMYRSGILLQNHSMPKFTIVFVFDVFLQYQKQISVALPIECRSYIKVIHIRYPFTELDYSFYKSRGVRDI